MMLKNDRDHTHADFSNHRSHLGIFASSLSNFSADLDDSVRQINTGSARWQQQQRQHAETGTDIKIDTTESTDSLTETYSEGRHEEYIFGEAGEFLKSQQKRLHNIEKQLLSRIEDILPVESDLMTATELVQACQRLHSVNVGFAQHLGSIHKLRGDTNEYGSTNQNEVPIPNTASRPPFRNGNESAPVSNKQPSRSQPLAPQFSTRGPLLQVAETDYETDATTTPATIMQRKGDSQIMHEIPDRAHLDSDSAIVPFQNRVYSASPGVDLIEAWRSRQSMNCGMENVDNHPISDSVFTQSTDCIPKDDHSGVEPREPSNDTYSGQDDSFASRGDCSSQFSRANTTAMCDDESVSLAPTVKGRGFFKRQALEQLRYGLDLVDTSHEQQQQQRELESDRQSEAPFSELVVNEDASESFQNNDLTFDRSMLNEQSMSSPTRSRIYEVGDESLLVTPVLARYRLEPDDSSIGVRVVPRDAVSGQARFPLPGKNRNFLAAHTQRENYAAATAAAAANESRKKHEKPIQQKSTPREKENVLNRIDERALLSPNVSVRTPQKYGKFDFDEDVVGAFKLNHSIKERENRHHIDERALLSPNVSVRTPQKIGNFESDENLTGAFKMEHPIEERENLSAKRKPSLSGVVAEATCRETGLTHHSEEMAMRRQTVDAAPSKVKVEAFAIAVVSFEEYDSAPSVIRMQVGVEEINASVHVLNLWFKANGSQQKGSPRLNEDTAARVLHTSSKRAKIVLMSLCHWRRLNMYMEESTSLMYFVPNQKQRSPRLTL